jgi:hypothetical protein
VQVLLRAEDEVSLDRRRGEDMKHNHALSASASCILAPHSNKIAVLLLSRCMWPPMRMRALVARALAQRLHAVLTLQCCLRVKRARSRCRRLAEVLPPALYRSLRCLAAVKLIQRVFISHRVKSLFKHCPFKP